MTAVLNRALRYLALGEYGRAMAVFDGSPLLALKPETVEAIRRLYPGKYPPLNLEAQGAVTSAALNCTDASQPLVASLPSDPLRDAAGTPAASNVAAVPSPPAPPVGGSAAAHEAGRPDEGLPPLTLPILPGSPLPANRGMTATCDEEQLCAVLPPLILPPSLTESRPPTIGAALAGGPAGQTPLPTLPPLAPGSPPMSAMAASDDRRQYSAPIDVASAALPDPPGTSNSATASPPRTATSCITHQALLRYLKSRRRGTGGGISGWTYDMLGTIADSELSLFVQLLIDITSGDVHADARSQLLHGRGIALRKPNGNPRPVGILEIFVRLASGILVSALINDITTAIEHPDLALGTPAGTEALVHAVRGHLTLHPDHATKRDDITNAFNSVSSEAIFAALGNKIPALAKLLHFLYDTPTLITYKCPEPRWSTRL